MLKLLETEVHEVLGLLGVTSFGQLDGSYLHPVAPVVQPHVHSAFPLTNLTDPGYRNYRRRIPIPLWIGTILRVSSG